jgi:hypothetical protein
VGGGKHSLASEVAICRFVAGNDSSNWDLYSPETSQYKTSQKWSTVGTGKYMSVWDRYVTVLVDGWFSYQDTNGTTSVAYYAAGDKITSNGKYHFIVVHLE